MHSARFDAASRFFARGRHSRRTVLARAGAGLAASAFGGPSLRRVAAQDSATPVPSAGGDPAVAILALMDEAMVQYDLRAVIVQVRVDGQDVVTAALGESLTGVPATTEMYFRNGAVAISYMSTLLLILVDRGVVGLDDPLANWLPEIRDADQVTLRMLANMTAGFPDHVQNAEFLAALEEDPFRQWTPEDLIAVSLSTPRVFAPGTNWDYSHAGYVVLGRALERIADAPLDVLLQEHVLAPLGLANTTNAFTPDVPTPVLHTFSSERRASLGIDPALRFYEETTFWNPSWMIAEGAIQTTTIADMTRSAEAIGTGVLLSPESHQAQIAPDLLGFGAPLEGCPTCHTLDEVYNYGLGIVRKGNWLLQNPLFPGLGSVMAYLPSQRIAISVVSTFAEGSADGRYGNVSLPIFVAIGSYLAPDEAPPMGGTEV
jgi:CubicO group peptidase (beta-lactamase class C family)